MTRSGIVGLLLLLCIAALSVCAFDLQRTAADLSPNPIPFAQYVARRSLGLHAAPEQRFVARMHAKRQQQREDTGADESLEPLAEPLAPSPNAVHLTVLHINDLYELIPSGTLGGVSRLGNVLRQLEALNPNNTLSVLAGDLFSPSALSTVPINGGPPLLGKQMVAVMNAMGLSAATLGNHETDVHEADFAARLDESMFPWLCINARNMGYEHLGATAIEECSNHLASPLNRTARLGIFGMTLDSNNKNYMSFDNFTTSLGTAARTVAEMRPQVDVLIALTHLPYWHDETLSQTVPGIDLITGGHEHKRIQIEVAGLPGIYKADSNVASTWIHDIFIDPSLPTSNPQRLVIESALVAIDSAIAPDPALEAVVQSWIAQGFAGFEAAGFQPASYLATPTVDLVGNNEVIFAAPTVLTDLFNLAVMQQGASYDPKRYNFSMPALGPDLSLYNAGAIRIDDTIPAGQAMTQYDAIRISPYSNSAALINVTGEILQRTLDAGMSRQNNSQFLHWYPNVSAIASASSASGFTYLINGAPLSNSASSWYLVSVLGFLLEGGAPYEFLAPSVSNTGVRVVAWDQSGDSDVRRSVIDQIAAMFSSTPGPSSTALAPGASSTGGGGGGAGPVSKPEKILGLSEVAFVLLMLAILLCVVLAAVTCVRRGAAARSSFEASKRRSDIGRAYLDLEGGDVSMPTAANERREAALLQNQYNDSVRAGMLDDNDDD